MLVLHAHILQNIRPLPTRPGMAVFQVLPEVVCAEEFLRVVALPELVYARQVLEPSVPVWLWEVGELLAAVSACIARRPVARLCRGGTRGVECSLVGR